MLVTPDGEWVFPNSEEFLARLGDATPDYDAISFAVKNLGFIKFQIIRQSIIEIELHPRNVELPALLAAQQQLLQAGIKLFRVRYFDTEWHSEISSSAERTVARLSELCTPVFTPATHERFIVEPQDFGQLFHDDENQLRPLAQKWRVTFAHFDPSFISLTVRQQLLPLTAIVGVKPPTNEPVFRFIGDGHRWVGTQYRVNGLGEKVENLPDRDYGGWVAEFYRSAASSGQPRTRDRTVELGHPAAVIPVGQVLDLLAEAVDAVLGSDPAMTVADKPENRLIGRRLDPDDRGQWQQLLTHRQRDETRIEMREGHPPFLRQGPQLVLVVVKELGKILRLDDEPLMGRRGEDRRAQFGQSRDRPLCRG